MHEPKQFPQYGAQKHHRNLLMCRDEIGVLPGFGCETGEVGRNSRLQVKPLEHDINREPFVIRAKTISRAPSRRKAVTFFFFWPSTREFPHN